MATDKYQSEENPYIALSDMAINLVLILIFFFCAANAIGKAGWEQVRYAEYQREFRRQLVLSLPLEKRPKENRMSNDPPGVQRWEYSEQALFHSNTAKLTPGGQESLVVFCRVLKRNQSLWRRVRIEGHTTPPPSGVPDDWELSAARAATVARVLSSRGHIPSYYLAVAGRAGQNPKNRSERQDPRNERVELVIEYTQKRITTSTEPVVSGPRWTSLERDAYLKAAAEADVPTLEDFISKFPEAINVGDGSGTSALHQAVAKNQLQVVRLLVARGANVNCAKTDGVTPLHVAAALGRTEAAKILLTAGAEINRKDDAGRTPLTCAEGMGHYPTAQLLESRGAER